MGLPEGGLGPQVRLESAHTWQDLAPGFTASVLSKFFRGHLGSVPDPLWFLLAPFPSGASAPASLQLPRSRDACPTLIYESLSVCPNSVRPPQAQLRSCLCGDFPDNPAERTLPLTNLIPVYLCLLAPAGFLHLQGKD